MPNSSLSDDNSNPLLLVKQAEEREEQRVLQAKKEIDAHELAEMNRLQAEEKSAETSAREEGQAALRAFAQTEPGKILQAGTDAAEKEIAMLQKHADAGKKTIVDTLVTEVLTGSPQA